MPSESGSTSDIVVVPRFARIGEFADALRKATSSARQQCGDRAPVRRSRRFAPTAAAPKSTASIETEVVMDTTVGQLTERVQAQITKARWALGINGALAVAVGVLII